MKHAFGALALLFICHAATAQEATLAPAPGIAFHQGSVGSLFARAAAEGKAVYVDVYTSWCGPCKRMAATVFPDSAVGAFMNARFVSYKIDAEQGEGVAFAARHKVAAYPTSLFFNSAGELVWQYVGFEGSKERYLATAARALQEIAAPENLLVMRRRFAAGGRETAFLYRYLDRLRDLGIEGYESRDVAEATLKALPGDGLGPVELLPLALANAEGGIAVYTACMARLDEIKQAAPSNQVGALQSALLSANERQLPMAAAGGRAALQSRLDERRHIMQGAPGRDEASVAQDEAEMRILLAKDHKQTEVLNPQVPVFVHRYWLSQTDSTLKLATRAMQPSARARLVADFAETKTPPEQQLERMAEAMSRDLARERLTADLNTFAWSYHQMRRPPAEQEEALRWIDFALKLRPGFHNAWDTKAHLHEDLKQYRSAAEAERRAIAEAEKATDDVDGYRDNLARFLAEAAPPAPRPQAAAPDPQAAKTKLRATRPSRIKVGRLKRNGSKHPATKRRRRA